MDIRSPCSGVLRRFCGRRTSTIVLAALLVGAILLAVESRISVPAAIPLPIVLGLAAHGGTDRDRESDLERLADQLEGVVDSLEERPDAAGDGGSDRLRNVGTGADVERDRDDAIGRLTAAVDELTTVVADREQRFAERERELRRTNERLEGIVEASPAAIVALDTDGTVERWNPAAERIFGWREAEVLGEPLPFVPDERSDDHDEIVDRVLDGETITGLETKRLTRDGDAIDVNVSAAPMRDADGEIVGTMAAIEDITDRKERERRLETTSARLEALFENSPDMIDVLDTDGTIVDANRRFCEVLGYPADDVIGTKIWEHDARLDADEVLALLEDTSVGERRKFESRYERRDGSSLPIEVHLIRLNLADENRFVVISRDVTERKTRERDLRETRRRLELALEGTNTGVWEWDLETDDLAWNETLERFVGLEPGSFEGTVEAFRRRVHPDDWSRIETTIERALEGGGLYQTEFRIRHEDGHWIWIDARGRLVADEDEHRRMIGIINDITERKERERELRERETQLQRYKEYTDDLLDAVDDVFYVLDSNGDLKRWNESLAAVTGYADDEIASMDSLEFFAESDRDSIAAAIEEVFETGSTRVEAPILTADGESVPYEFVASRLEDLDGNTVVTGVGRDISERKRYERDLERTTELLEQAQDLASVGGWELDVRSEPYETTATDEFYRQLGLDRDPPLTPEAVISQFHPDDRQRIRSALEGAIEDGEGYDLEARVQPADGETRWARAIGEPVFEDGDEGTVAAVRGSIQDITESRERERRVSTLMSNVPGMVYRCRNEPDWPFEFVSEGCRELTGYDPEALVEGDVNWADDVALEYHDEIRETIKRAVANRDPFQVVYPIETADGERRWLSERGRGVFGADDALDALEGVITDVTERVESEREIERTTRLLEQAQRLANVGAWELDVRTEPYEVRWTDEVSRIHGLSPDEDVDLEESIDFYHPEDRDEIRTAVERAIEDGESYELELRLIPRDGEMRWVRTIGEPIYEAGEVVKLQGSFQNITERKRRERELERYETIVQAVGDPVYTLDESGEFRFVNDAIESVAGYGPEELIGRDIEDVLMADDLDTARQLVRELLEEEDKSYETFEMALETADGEVIETENHMALLPTEDGEFAGTAGVVRDITDRKERERELERYETIIQAIGDPVYTVDETGKIRFINDAIESLAGYEPEELIGRNAEDVITPKDFETSRRLAQELLEEDKSYETFEMDHRTADGGVVETENHMALLPTEDGEFAGTAGVVRDITDRKERERELERYETIIQAVGDPVYTLDETGEIRFINDAIESLAGHDPEELIGSDVSAVLPPDDLERARELVRELLRENKSYGTVETDFRTVDGEVVETETHVALLPMDDGEFTGTAGVIRDITERKERERELERTTELLEQAQRIAGVAGWELDVTTDPYELTLTPQLERLFDLERSASEGGLETKLDVADAIELYHPDDRARVLSAVDDAVEHGESYDLEVRMVTEDGEQRWVRTIGEPVREQGEIVAVRGSIQDITERKERERDLERTRDLLERVQRMAGVGGWEMDLGGDEPRTAVWTDEMYRLHDLSRDAEPDLETTVECYHPDDRPFVRDEIERAIETETGYDLEGRILTDDGDVRWVRAISEPIRDADGNLVTYRGTVQDITDRKRRELALESLHETARGLLNAETESAVADLVVDTAAELLESDDASASVYLLDSETNRFESAASTPAFVDRFDDGVPSVAVGDGDSVLWSTYVTGTQTIVDDAEIGDRSPLFGDAPGGLLIPIGNHGVFVLVAPPASIDDETRQLFETLVATTEAAFDRLESEASLRERDAELEARNRRLRRQIQITELIRGIDRSLIGADSRDEIERTVPERLLEADSVSFAWIGDLNASASAIEPRTWAGDEPEYLDAVALDLEGDSTEPSVRTARSETPTVVENVVEGLQREPWRTNALDAGFQSVLSVPIAFEEYSYGVLTVYADEPDAFTDLERTVLAELGEGIANAITAAKTQEALHSETLVELTLEIEGDDVLSRIARTTGGRVTYEGLGTASGSETVLFFETSDVSPDDVRDALADLVSVTDFRLVTESEDGCLFEATVTGDIVASRLVRHGGSPRSITADGTRIDVTVDVPPATDVREFIEMLAEQYESVELQSRRHVQRAMQTRQELVASLFDDLTDRQLEVLRTAYLAGFFEWPRESTGEEIADMLDVTQPTVNRHLRIGQQRLLSQLFENETLSLADGSRAGD